MRDFKKYDIWMLSHNLTLEVYKASEKFPESENLELHLKLEDPLHPFPQI